MKNSGKTKTKQVAGETEKTGSALSETEIKYKTLFGQSPQGILIIDTEGNILDFNEAAHRQLGYSREEFTRLHISDIDPGLTPGELRAKTDAILKRGRAEFETRHRAKNGEMRDVHVIMQVLMLSGSPVLHSIWCDITERKSVEEASRNSAQRYRVLFDQSPDGILIIDTNGKMIEFNEAANRMLGYSKDEFERLRIPDINVDSPEKMQACVSRLLESGEAEFEAGYRAKDGSVKDVQVISRTIDLGGRTVFHSILRDITGRKRAEYALRLSEERLSRAQKMAHVGNWEWNVVDNELYWSEEVFRIYGREPGVFVPTFDEVKRAMHPEDLAPFLKAVNEALYENKPFEMDYRLIRPDGTERTIHTIGEVSRDTAGRPVVKSGTVQDITELKRIEGELKRSREFIKSILDTVDEAFIVVDAGYRIVLANNAYAKQVGTTVQDLIGKRCFEISHRSERPCCEAGEECAVRRTFDEGEPAVCIHKHYTEQGDIIYVEAKSYPLKDSTGKISSVIEVINNITDKHLLEEQMLRTQKLEAVGLLAGGIAHDFNNLLQGVFGSISVAKSITEKDGRLYRILGTAERALDLSRNLTKQLLTFAKGGEPVKKIISMQPVVRDSVKFALSGSNLDYSVSTGENLWAVEADEGQISQVIHNIVLNASDAMPDGGKIRIEISNLSVEKGNRLPLPEGDYVVTAIEDSGEGIPGQHISRIFDPYFTTKAKGSGLGLATSYSIISRHKGLLDVKSEPGAGSTFFIYLPACKEKRQPEEVRERPPLTGSGRILLMDDEEIMQIVAEQMLRALGYDVDLSRNGEQAIEKYRAAMNAGKPYDAVILDLTVRGGMGGIETIKRLSEMDTPVKAVVSSGYSEESIESHYRDYGFSAILPKPYVLEELNRILRSVLAQTGRSLL